MRIFQKIGTCVLGLAPIISTGGCDGALAADTWRADPQQVRRLNDRRPALIYDEADVPDYELPNPLQFRDGSLVRSPQDWPARRAEILELFRSQMFGRRPGKPHELRFETLEENPAALDGAATLRRIAIHSRQHDRSHQFELILFIPNASKKPTPAFLLLNNRPAENIDPTRRARSDFWPVEAMIARGYAMATFAVGRVAPDDKQTFRDGILATFEGLSTTKSAPAGQPPPRPLDAPGALAAWGWGASRAMDYLETDDRIDAKHVAVLGHSRGGKAALWAGAEDERFALVISNGSGCGGAALSRRCFGETVRIINTAFPHWFCDAFKRYNDRENELPFDQHMLIALIAPRAVYVASGSEDLWADPRGEFLSLAGASGVYALWGLAPIGPDTMPAAPGAIHAPSRGYHIHAGPHDLGLYDWQGFADFADRTCGDARSTPVR